MYHVFCRFLYQGTSGVLVFGLGLDTGVAHMDPLGRACDYKDRCVRICKIEFLETGQEARTIDTDSLRMARLNQKTR